MRRQRRIHPPQPARGELIILTADFSRVQPGGLREHQSIFALVLHFSDVVMTVASFTAVSADQTQAEEFSLDLTMDQSQSKPPSLNSSDRKGLKEPRHSKVLLPDTLLHSRASLLLYVDLSVIYFRGTREDEDL